MSKRGAKKNTILEVIVAIIFIVAGIMGYDFLGGQATSETATRNILTAEETENITLNGEDRIKIYFFDVGQADSILLVSNSKTMLIDAGTNEAGKTVVKNIQNLGISKIDYLVGTHPHEDHIGGLDDVINNFEIGTIYMPKIQTNTKTFEDVLDAANNKGLKISSPKEGDTFKIGDIDCEIMLCDVELAQKNSNLNLSSIAIRATFKEQSYLFMGDCEKENENTRSWPQTNVLKVGHHGSDTSSSQNFLNQVKPQIAIIQVGKDNSYGHPKQAILNRFSKLGTLVYRTDEKGTIVIESDGENNKVYFMSEV